MEQECYGVKILRRHEVVKANALIQQSRHSFSLQQQKILLYLISQIKPEQENFIEQTFNIPDFCRVCEIDYDSGKNYSALKSAVMGIRNKGFWLKKGDGEVTVSWISRVEITPKSGVIKIKLDEEMKPYLLDLHANYTKYHLIYTLTMRSKYAVRLYELLKSFEHMEQPINFGIDRLKILIGAEYTDWRELNRRAVAVAVMEINTVSDISVTYNGRRKGRSFGSVDFTIKRKKDFESQVSTERAIYNRLTKKHDRHHPPQVDGQLSLDDEEPTDYKRLLPGEMGA